MGLTRDLQNQALGRHVSATNPPDDSETRSDRSTTGPGQVPAAQGHTWPAPCFCTSGVTGTRSVSVSSGATAEATAQDAELFARRLGSAGRFCQPPAVVKPAPGPGRPWRPRTPSAPPGCFVMEMTSPSVLRALPREVLVMPFPGFGGVRRAWRAGSPPPMSAVEDDVSKTHLETLRRGLPGPLMSVTSLTRSPRMDGPWATHGTRLWGQEQRPARPLGAHGSVDLGAGDVSGSEVPAAISSHPPEVLTRFCGGSWDENS